ncbi:MAG: amino acid transporter substrate-binding protein [Pedobacter sp.]|jgi:ABC-type amino acid transport substrate-binding protein|nr:amino acid transporter substrate-binding protein [Pedobacter sp.]
MKRFLKIGLDSAAPFPMHTDLKSNIFEGFEVDLIKVIAEALELDVQYEVSLWKDILPQLYKGELDMICSAVTVTASRKHILEFSDPYLHFRLCAVVRHGDTLTSSNDFKNKIIGVRAAAVAEKYIMDEFPANMLVHADANIELYDSLNQGRIDIVVDDSPIAGGFLRRYEKLKIGMFIPDTESNYAIAMKKGDVNLKNQINEVLRKMKENGLYDALFTKWFTHMQL